MDSPSNEKCNSLPSPAKIHHVMLHCWSGGLWGLKSKPTLKMVKRRSKISMLHNTPRTTIFCASLQIKTFNCCCTPVNRITSSQRISDILMIHHSIEYIILFTINTVFMKVSQGKCLIN